MGNDDKFMADIYKLLELDSPKKLIDIINERMNEYEISQYQMGKILSISKSTFNRLIENIEKGEVQNVDFYSILKIAQFLNISIGDISQFYISSMKPELIAELETSRKANFLHRNFDLKALKSIGFIDDLYDIGKIEKRIVEFFEIPSLFDYKNEIGSVLFSSSRRKYDDKMREFWVRSAYYQFRRLNNENEYSRDKLLALVPKIRPYTRHEEKGMLTVCQALYNIGITVIVQPYLSKTSVRGGCFAVNNKPCIVITDFNDTYATLWFALLHELYHVLYDFNELKSSWIYHLTDDRNFELFEKEDANNFPYEILFSQEKLNYIKHMISSPLLVNDYAKKNEVHPSIIYSFYCYEQNKQGKNVYPLYQQYFGNPAKALNVLKTNPFNKKKITEVVEIIKNNLEGQFR